MDIGSFFQVSFDGSTLAKESGFFESAAETIDWRSGGDLDAQSEPISFLQTIQKLFAEAGQLEDIQNGKPMLSRCSVDSGEIEDLGHEPPLTGHAGNESEVHRKDRGQTICSLELMEKRRGIMEIGPFFQILDGGSTSAKGNGFLEGATANSGWQSTRDSDGDNQATSFFNTIKQFLDDSEQSDATVEEGDQNGAYRSDDVTQLLSLIQLIENRSVNDLKKSIDLEPQAGVASEASQSEVFTLLKEQLDELRSSLKDLSENNGEDQTKILASLNTKLGDMESQIKEALSNSTEVASNDETLKVIEYAFSKIKNDIVARMEDQVLNDALKDKTLSVDNSNGVVSLIGGEKEGMESGLDGGSVIEDASVLKETKGKMSTERMDKEALFGKDELRESDFSARSGEMADIDDGTESGNCSRNVTHQKAFNQNVSISSQRNLEQQMELSEVMQQQDRNQRRSLSGNTQAKSELSASTADSKDVEELLTGFKEEIVDQKDRSTGLKDRKAGNEKTQSQISALNIDSDEDFNMQEKMETNKQQAKTVEADMGKPTSLESAKSDSSKETSMDISFSDEESLVEKKSHTASVSRTASASDTSDLKFQKTVMDQIVEKATLRSMNDRTEVRIQLKPESLGDVRMSIVSEKNHLVVQMVADRAETKEIIEGQLHHLKAELDKQGLTVSRIEVAISANGDQQDSREQFAQMFKNNTNSNGKRQNGNQREAFSQNQSNQENTTEDEDEGINYFV